MPRLAFEVSSGHKLHHRATESLVRPILTHGAGGRRKGILDLSDLEFITPYGVVVLTTILNRDAHGFQSLQLVCPESFDCLNYLAASGFFQHLPDYVTLKEDLGRGTKEGSWDSQTVLPLTNLDNTSRVAEVTSKIRERVAQMMGEDGNGEPKALTNLIPSTTQEMCQNIFDHARVQQGWVAAQRYSNVPTPYIELALGDAGCGIRTTLVDEYPELRERGEATVLRLMIKKGLSRREGGGMGYNLLRTAADELDGRFLLRSGRGAVRKPRHRSGLTSSTKECEWPGTQLMVRFSCA